MGLPGQTPATPAPVDAAHRHIPPLIDQMIAGKLTPRRAWDEKLLTVDDLLWIFTTYIDPWGSFRWKFHDEARRGLARLLAQHGGEKLQPLEKVPPTVRLWLADYYMSVPDEKCVALSESILKEIKTPVQTDDPLAFQTVERIARYYAAQGDDEKGANTWLRMGKFYSPKGIWLPDSLIEAARLYVSAGNAAKAKELYAQVPQFNQEYFSQLAFQERIHLAGVRGEWDEMRQLMKLPLGGSDEAGAKLTELSFMARFSYKAGKFKEARQYAQQAIAFQKSLQAPFKAPLIENWKGMAEEILEWAERWQQLPVPVFADPRKYVDFVPRDKKPIVFQLAVRSFRRITATVTSNSPLVKVRPITTQPMDSITCFSNIVKVEIAPVAANTTLILRSLEYPDFEIRVPISLQVQRDFEHEPIDVIVVD